MGKSAARLLAKKGADVIIVSRAVAKLEAALAEVKVIHLSPCILQQELIHPAGFSDPPIPTIPLYLSRPGGRRQRSTRNRGSHSMEQWESS